MTDEHFINWMRVAGKNTFRKLWGRIEQNLEKGRYTLKIKNNFNVREFSGTKSFVLTTVNEFGGKNFYLAMCYIVAGTICMLFALIFFIAYMTS